MRPLPKSLSAGLAAVLAGCATTVVPPAAPPAPQPNPQQVQAVPPARPAPPPVSTRFRQPQILQEAGLEEVIGAHAPALVRLFGEPQLDAREGDVRKLQFSGEACVLDVFLYPIREHGEPEATWVDARRRSDGLEVNRAACVAALRR
jgi:hypothetical protein